MGLVPPSHRRGRELWSTLRDSLALYLNPCPELEHYNRPLMRYRTLLALTVSLSLAAGISPSAAHDSIATARTIEWRAPQADESRLLMPTFKRNVSPTAAVLRPTNLANGLGIQPVGPRVALTTTETILGRTKLVAFASSAGLCVEIDHDALNSRAGGCSFRPLPAHRQIWVAAIGFSSGLGQEGVTEILGMAGPAVQSVQVSYASDARRRHLSVPVGELPRSIMKGTDIPSSRWFAIDASGCLESRDVRMRALGPHHSFLGSAKGLDQHAACQAGIGYKTRGALIYGSLPPS